MKRQQGFAVALIFGCVFAAPSNARQNPQTTVGPVTQFCGERVCPNLSTTPKVIDRSTGRRHRVVRAVLPKPRPMDANGNPGNGLVTVATAAGIIVTRKTMGVASPEAASEVEIRRALSSSFADPSMPIVREPLLVRKEETNSDSLENEQTRLVAAFDALTKQQARLEALFDALAKQRGRAEDPVLDHSPDAAPTKRNFSDLAYYVFSEIPPDEKPADVLLETMKGVPIGPPVEEIKRASDAFGLDFSFMKAVAKIESGFNPKQRTGSYIGLFQLSKYEFKRYGSGNITDPRDNAIAGAYKFATEALLFEFGTGKKPTFSDLYLIHQQGWQGAAEHVAHPKRIAWRSMCATEEGKEKGERWCKRAIWGNTLPAIKQAWKSVDKLTSAAFVGMWQQRVADLYSRYSMAATKN
ncbi:MAG: transglycosylase SLT domain-containing protein [Chthoniobacterales bacterium]